MKTEKTTTEIPNSTNTVLTAVCQVIALQIVSKSKSKTWQKAVKNDT